VDDLQKEKKRRMMRIRLMSLVKISSQILNGELFLTFKLFMHQLISTCIMT